MRHFSSTYHKWVGLLLTFFILMFAVSGILLNHRQAIASLDVSRGLLPDKYAYVRWNNGAIVGTLPIDSSMVMMYGNSGVWLSDPQGNNIRPFIVGLPRGIDNQTIRAAAKTLTGDIFIISAFQLYRLDASQMQWVKQQLHTPHLLTDVQTRGDTLLVMSRSYLYLSVAPYTSFHRLELKAPANYNRKVSLFRTIWLLHSGELYGLIGKLVVDAVGIVVIFLCITGLVLIFFKIPLKRRRRQKLDDGGWKKPWLFSLRWHNKLGAFFLGLLLLIVLTGMFLRPPLLIPIARGKVSPLLGSTLSSKNPWNDKLRRIRYDESLNRWMLSSSDGFYSLSRFDDKPQKMKDTPPVSVMGLTVWQPTDSVEWVVGSFSGIYRWNPEEGFVSDFLSGKPLTNRRGGRPSISNAVSGYSLDFEGGNLIFDYARGIPEGQLPMPPEMGKGRISLWNVALELHVGRLYSSFLGSLASWYVFLSGLLFLLVVITGYMIYRKKFRKKKRKSSGNH